MDEDSSGTFFTRLRMLCRQVDQDLRVLKEDFHAPPGSAPQFYDRGLNALKDEFKVVKKVNEETKKVQRSVQNFSNWLQSMQELVNKQGDDIGKIEKYLVKFGYAPIEKPAGLMPAVIAPDQRVVEEKNTSDSKSMVKVSDSKNVETGTNVKRPPVSKPLKDVNRQQNVQGKGTTLQDASAKLVKSVEESTYHRTPVSSKAYSSHYTKESAQRGSVQSSGYVARSVTVEQWLEGVKNGSPEITPDVLHTKRLYMREKLEMQDIDTNCRKVPSSVKNILPSYEINENSESNEEQPPEVPQTPVSNVPANKHLNGTPVEPELSEYTTQFLITKPSSVRKANTSKSLFLLKEDRIRNTEKDHHPFKMIPEEPVRTHTPEERLPSHEEYKLNTNCSKKEESFLHSSLQEPVLSHQTLGVTSSTSLSQVGAETPEEPVLTYPIPRAVLKCQTESRTPEEPVLSYQVEQRTQVAKMRTPEEPVLSIQLPECRSVACDDDSKTPEEPVLFYQMPENIATSKLKVQTPEEPQLSCQYQKGSFTARLDEKTPEAPVLSSYASAMQSMQNCAGSLNQVSHPKDIPASPELSDITQSFLSLRNQSCIQDRPEGIKKHRLNTSIKQESHPENNRMQFSRNGKILQHPIKRTETKTMQEDFPQSDTDHMDSKRKWHRPSIAMEQFLSMDNGDIPPSPQLSETTQRLFSRMY